MAVLLMTRRGDFRLGIALMEVLVAMAVVGVALGALLDAMSVALRSQARLEERFLVRRLAESRLLELRCDAAAAQPGESRGRFPEPFAAYDWTCAVTPSQSGEPFHLLTLTVRKGGQPHAARIQALLAAPE